VRLRVTPTAIGLRLQLPSELRELVEHTVGQVVELLDAGSGDPAMERLLPAAYADDPEAALEFRRLTEDDLLGRKRSDAQVVIQTAFAKELDVEQAESWLRSLTDVRLVLAQRLGITQDGEAEELLESGDEGTRQVVLVMASLGYVQELLIEALDSGGF
jgi:hypothetical protein